MTWGIGGAAAVSAGCVPCRAGHVPCAVAACNRAGDMPGPATRAVLAAASRSLLRQSLPAPRRSGLPPRPHLLLLCGKVALDAVLQRGRRVAVDEREHVQARQRCRVLERLGRDGGRRGAGRTVKPLPSAPPATVRANTRSWFAAAKGRPAPWPLAPAPAPPPHLALLDAKPRGHRDDGVHDGRACLRVGDLLGVVEHAGLRGKGGGVG
jgi:hypothetical protein